MKAAIYARFVNGPFPREYRLDVADDDRAQFVCNAITDGRLKFCRTLGEAKNETRYVNVQQATEIIFREYE